METGHGAGPRERLGGVGGEAGGSRARWTLSKMDERWESDVREASSQLRLTERCRGGVKIDDFMEIR